jgi:hypothetical protein
MAAKKAAPADKAPKAEAKKKAQKKAPANPFTGDSKFAKFLTSKKLDARRVLAASHQLEQLQRSDRDIKLARRQAKGGAAEGGDDKKAEAPKTKPRSGRPVTRRAMFAAVKGAAINGPTKTRILRAVNHLLEQKKQEKVDLKALF